MAAYAAVASARAAGTGEGGGAAASSAGPSVGGSAPAGSPSASSSIVGPSSAGESSTSESSTGGSSAGASTSGAAAAGKAGQAAAQTVPSTGEELAPAPPVGGAAPAYGSTVRLGQAPNLFQSAALPPLGYSAPPQGLVIVPSIGVSEEFAAGGFNTPGVPNNDFITSIRPALSVSDGTGRTRVSLTYAPSALLYARRSDQDYVAQNLNGDAVLILAPKTFTVTARAYVTQQATRGGYPAGGNGVLVKGNRTTSESFSINPVYQQQIIGLGTIGLSYLASYTRQSGEVAVLPANGLPYFVPNHVFEQAESASYTTPPIAEQFDDIVQFQAIQNQGSGVLEGAHQIFANDTIRYAFIRHGYFAVSGGYEDIVYGGVPPTEISDFTWSVGVHLQPRPREQLIAEYRHQYGFNAPYVSATLPVGARTTLAVSYSETLNTPLTSLGNGVSSTLVNGFGQPVAPTTSAPVQLTNSSLAVQNSLSRDRQFALSTTTIWARDTLSLDLRWSQNTLVAVAPGQTGFSQTAYYATVTFSRRLSRRLAASAYLEYGRSSAVTFGSGSRPIYLATASATYQLAPQTTGSLQLSVGNQGTGIGGYGGGYGGYGGGYGYGSGVQGSITVALERSFR